MRLFLVITFCCMGLQLQAQQDPQLRQLAAYRDSVISYQESYFNQTLKEPTNRGAKRIAFQLDSLHLVMAEYQLGQQTREQLRQSAQLTLQETERYNSTRARRITAILQQIIQLCSLVPERLRPEQVRTTDTTKLNPLTPTPNEASYTETDRDLARQHARENSWWYQAINNGTVWLLTSAALLGTVGGLGLWFYMRQRKLVQQHAIDLAALKTQLQAAQENDKEEFMLLRDDLVRKLDSIERHTGNFLQSLDKSRLATNEQLKQQDQRLLAMQPYGELLLHVQERMQLLEERIQLLEMGRVSGNPEPASTSTPRQANELTSLAKALLELHEQTKIEDLAELCHAILHNLQHHKGKGAPVIEEAVVARLIQLSYVSAVNELKHEQYAQVLAYFKKDDYIVEDQMAGRMAFSDHYAENTSYDEYISRPKVDRADQPDHRLVRKTIEEGTFVHLAVKNTVLFVLLPAIIRRRDGARAIVAKGKYIVKG